VESQVFEQDDTIGIVFRNLLGSFAHAIFREGHRLAKELRQSLTNHAKRQVRASLSFRPAEMRAEHDTCFVLPEILDRRYRCPDPGIVGNFPVLQGDVEVRPHKHRFPADGDVADCPFSDYLWSHRPSSTRRYR
jgi:hypothetical protein